MNTTEQQEILYRMALTRVMRMGATSQWTLLREVGSATAIFEDRRQLSRSFQQHAPVTAKALAQMEDELPRCEQEMQYAEQHHISILTADDSRYPVRLLSCPDAPLVLYHLGHTNLNAKHIVSIVGTRHATTRGNELCQSLIADLARRLPDTLIVSGLAYGIDVDAHRACLEHQVPTLGVVAHGLDQIYPREHRHIAVEMMQQGGVLSEFMSGTKIDKMFFVQRNRIVAGMADATVVVESPAKGGSLITTELANDYNREVFAYPGRTTDKNSEGCLGLIRQNKAHLITCADDLLADMGWTEEAHDPNTQSEAQQLTLFPDLSEEEYKVVTHLQRVEDDSTLAQLATATGMAVPSLLAVLFSLEMKGLVKTLAGSKYHLLYKKKTP